MKVSEGWAEQLLSLFEGKSAGEAGDVLGLLQIFSQVLTTFCSLFVQWLHYFCTLLV